MLLLDHNYSVFRPLNFILHSVDPIFTHWLICEKPMDSLALLFQRNALRRVYSYAAVVPCVRPSVRPSVR